MLGASLKSCSYIIEATGVCRCLEASLLPAREHAIDTILAQCVTGKDPLHQHLVAYHVLVSV